MPSITKKGEVKAAIDQCTIRYKNEGADGLTQCFHRTLLQNKVRFPLLEYAATLLVESVPEHALFPILDQLVAFREIGSGVIAGKALQERLLRDYQHSMDKAVEYIITGDSWYACDTMSERVMGYALLTQPEKTLHQLHLLATHDNHWIVRSVGIAAHYATKKGLGSDQVENVLQLLIRLAPITSYYTKKGIGWGGKTIAKFHPHLIEKYREAIDDPGNSKWFKSKIKIGLNMSKNAV